MSACDAQVRAASPLELLTLCATSLLKCQAALADRCCLSFVAGTLVRLAESYTMTDEQREQGGRVRSFFTDAAAQSLRLVPSAGLKAGLRMEPQRCRSTRTTA